MKWIRVDATSRRLKRGDTHSKEIESGNRVDD
jgi:hypothetical protein